MTSLDWLFEKLWELPKDKLSWHSVLEQAKEMHKQEIIDAFKSGLKSPYHQDYTFVTQDNQEGTKSGQYYQETFVSKGSYEVELPKQETLYTEEQVMEAMKFARTFNSAIRDIDYIKSLKQGGDK